MDIIVKKCIYCGEELHGRIDKKFCDNHCKSAFQYKNNSNEAGSIYFKIDKQLKKNRSLLKQYNKAGKATVRLETLIEQGFNPKIFTHYWKNGKGDVYLFVYEFGFLQRKEGGKTKLVLIQWQEFMNKFIEPQ